MERPVRSRPAGHALIAGLVGLVLASLLNAHSLAEIAQRQEEGVTRTIATALTSTAVTVSSALWLDRPREAIDSLLGRGDPPTVERPVATSSPQPTGAPSVDPPTAADPASAWIIGDSLMELLGPRLSEELAATGVVEPEVDFRFITGLSRPDVFDWPAHIRDRVDADPPDLVVAMFGGNDGQPVIIDGTRYEEYTPDWWDVYRARVAEAMDALAGDRIAFWVGLPVVRDATFREHARSFNEVYREEAEARPWMRFIDIWDVFTDSSGRYADYLPNLNGDLRLMRYADGVHFTPSGALRLALHVFEAIDTQVDLP